MNIIRAITGKEIVDVNSYVEGDEACFSIFINSLLKCFASEWVVGIDIKLTNIDQADHSCLFDAWMGLENNEKFEHIKH